MTVSNGSLRRFETLVCLQFRLLLVFSKCLSITCFRMWHWCARKPLLKKEMISSVRLGTKWALNYETSTNSFDAKSKVGGELCKHTIHDFLCPKQVRWRIYIIWQQKIAIMWYWKFYKAAKSCHHVVLKMIRSCLNSWISGHRVRVAVDIDTNWTLDFCCYCSIIYSHWTRFWLC